MSQLYVGNIESTTTIHDLAREFEPFGEICSINIPQTFSRHNHAFVEFNNRNDAFIAIQSWYGKFNWRVELSRHSKLILGGGGGGGGGGFGNFSRGSYSVYGEGVEQSQRRRMKKKKKKKKVVSTSTLKPVLPPSPPWLELPEDITSKILHKLGPIELLVTARFVCTTWQKICRDPTMWRVIDMWQLGHDVYDYKMPYHGLEDLCRLAVDLSQGKVTEINIGEFASDDLLEYIAERCGNLRCLRLAYCDDVSNRCLCKAVKGFPLLEVLHLQFTYVEKEDIEAIGQSCPLLKTFALNGRKGGDEALAIATSMPKLRHLQLFGHKMTNEVLETILNGCPKLESLDLRNCFKLDLGGKLGKRCTQQLKILRRPGDPTHDYEWDGWDSSDSDDDY